MTRKFYVVGNLTVDVIENKIRGGGPGYYMGIALSLLEEKVYLVGNIGRDYPRKELEELKKLRVNLKTLNWTDKSTSFKIEYSNESRSLKVLCRGEKIKLDFRRVDSKGIIVYSPVLREVEVYQVDKCKKLKREYAIDIQGFSRKISRSKVVNFWNPSISKVIEGSYLVHLGIEEATMISKDPLKVLNKILDHNLHYTAITLGVKGSIVGSRNEAYVIPPLKIFRGDPTGAGDVYTGVLLAYLLKGEKLEVAGAKATVAAGLKIKRNKIPWYTVKELELGSLKVLEKTVKIY